MPIIPEHCPRCDESINVQVLPAECVHCGFLLHRMKWSENLYE